MGKKDIEIKERALFNSTIAVILFLSILVSVDYFKQLLAPAWVTVMVVYGAKGWKFNQ